MNILMVVTWYGEKGKDFFTGNFHYELAKALQKSHNVAIYFPFDNVNEKGVRYEEEGGILTFRNNIGATKFNRMVNIYADIKKIKAIYEPDIIHAHVANGAGLVALFAKKIFRIPYVLTEHAPIEMMNFSKKGKLKTSFILSNSKANIAVSTDLRDKLNKIYKKANFSCIYNGVIDPYLIMSQNVDNYRVENCVNAVIMCGLYSKTIKGLQYLLPAIEMVNKSSKKVHLHICGGGNYLEYFIDMSKKIGIENDVTFYGMCDKPLMYSILNQMDFAISASLYESAGVSVEESCMMGKPMVVTKSGGANSLIPDVYSIKIEVGSEKALCNALNTMIDTYKNYDSEEMKNYGFSNFEMEKICQKYEKIYSREEI